MRADRLIATLLLLQRRGRVTAAKVAAELEVSERTARRDLEALALAGVPVFSTRGRGGGWSLVGGARTDLTGLTAGEARALFLVAGPGGSAEPEVRAALRKLEQALPVPLREQAAAAGDAVLVDPAAWGRALPPGAPAALAPLQRAVVSGDEVLLRYTGRDRRTTERTVSPLGLVDKGGTWYVVAHTPGGVRTFRVDRVAALTPTGRAGTRPAGFDLAAAWREGLAQVEARRTPARVCALVDPTLVRLMRGRFGPRLSVRDPAADGRVAVELSAPTVEVGARELAGHGAGLEVTAPPEARAVLAQLARELTGLYDAPAG